LILGVLGREKVSSSGPSLELMRISDSRNDIPGIEIIYRIEKKKKGPKFQGKIINKIKLN
jgi:hypothetical protein